MRALLKQLAEAPPMWQILGGAILSATGFLIKDVLFSGFVVTALIGWLLIIAGTGTIGYASFKFTLGE